ncbi:MAG: YbbR-like domain-containing protein [Armatimonadota bacterium]|jgi:YbbR domain-containing protein
MAGRRVRNWLRDTFVENWPVKLLSLIVATILWLHVLGTEDPQSTQAVTVAVVPVNEPEGLKTIGITPATVELRLRGRESALAQAQVGRIRMEANLRSAAVGENQVPLRVSGVPLSLAVVPGHPNTATVQLDNIIERQRPVQDIVRGEPARGFVIEQIAVDPEEVTVRGATSVVREVARAVVVVDVSGINQSAPFSVQVEARDNRNVAVSDVTFEPRTVTVTVTVRELNVKYVPVRPVLGNPPAGYSVTAVRTEPQIVTVTSEDDLSEVRSVPTLPVDISGLRGSKDYSVSLNVPPGLRVEGPASVQVIVTTQRTGAVGSEPLAPEPVAPDETDDDPSGGEDNDRSPENQNGERPPGEDGRDRGADADDDADRPAAQQNNSATTPTPGNGDGT